jgi:leucyl-tRNA synthetase
VDISKEEMEQLALNHEKVVNFIQDKEVVKVVIIPGKLVNVVVKG